MTSTHAFFVGFTLLLGLAMGLIVFLRRPLREILIELCGRESRARFWECICAAGVVVSTLFAAMIVDPATSRDAGEQLLSMARYGLASLLGCIGLLGFLMLRSIVSYEDAARRNRETEPYSA